MDDRLSKHEFRLRITVEELGCQAILTHSKHAEILKALVTALDVNDPSRSTNAAFAIGRLIEGNDGKKTLIANCGEEKLVSMTLKSISSLHLVSDSVPFVTDDVRSSRRERSE